MHKRGGGGGGGGATSHTTTETTYSRVDCMGEQVTRAATLLRDNPRTVSLSHLDCSHGARED